MSGLRLGVSSLSRRRFVKQARRLNAGCGSVLSTTLLLAFMPHAVSLPSRMQVSLPRLKAFSWRAPTSVTTSDQQQKQERTVLFSMEVEEDTTSSHCAPSEKQLSFEVSGTQLKDLIESMSRISEDLKSLRQA
mmetsp:Transcript_6073/g.22261  ORF Transcript_6073/g.22261 Transcript_6073/m.22261 type:complete len:133 (-) Transcript_6073:2572-2970(-)